MPKVQITDTILRDAHQSQAATRMRLDEMLPACEMLDKVGYYSLECWGGATFDSCLRFLNEDPWDRLRQLRKALLAEGFAHGARRLGTALLCRAQRGGLHGLYGDVPDLFEQLLQLLPGETAALELCQMRRRFKGGAAREHAAQLQRAPGERDLAAAAELPLHAA